MKVYLMRHGDYAEKDSDLHSHLSKAGELQVKRIGDFLLSKDVKIAHFFHSGKLRAQQTAELLAKKIHYKGMIEERSGLHPFDLVSPIASEINQADQDVFYIGHMPFMGKLVAKLVTDNEGYDIIFFKTATLVCLEKIVDSTWVIKWVVNPEVVG